MVANCDCVLQLLTKQSNLHIANPTGNVILRCTLGFSTTWTYDTLKHLSIHKQSLASYRLFTRE